MTQEPKRTQLLTVAEVAAMLRVSKMTVYRMAAKGGPLTSIKVSPRSIRITESSLNGFLVANSNQRKEDDAVQGNAP